MTATQFLTAFISSQIVELQDERETLYHLLPELSTGSGSASRRRQP